MTKEELLQKGITEEELDQYVSSLSSDSQEEDPLQALQKALDGDPEMDTLLKAEKNEDDDKDDSDEGKEEYNEKFMKKMKRYMKEKGKIFKDMKDSEKDMKKAVEDLDLESEGAVVEMEDLAPLLNILVPAIENMAKAIPELAERIEVVSAQTDKNYDLMQKAAKVTVEQSKSVNEFLNVPNGRKGVTESTEMQKAQKTSIEQSKIIYDVLLKAVKEKDKDAGYIISAFESAGKDLNRLNQAQKTYIHQLIQKEAN